MNAARLHWLLFFVLLAAGICGVTATYLRLSWTDDELFHIFCGMEWWENGTYTRQPLHPPLARVADAALQYLWQWIYGPQVFERMDPREAYYLKLVLARLGTLPFYIGICLLVYRWSRACYGRQAALCSLALLVTISSLSAHSALATTDVAYACVFLWALWRGIVWLEAPDKRNALHLGAAAGIMVGTKFSALAHWPAAMIAIAASSAAAHYFRARNPWVISRRHVVSALFALPAAAFALALIYRFQLSAFVAGIEEVRKLDDAGFGVWFYGPFKKGGSPEFFPVVFFYKTSLPFLALALGSVIMLAVRMRKGAGAQLVFPVVAAASVMLVSMTSQINLGVRHVLPVYPLLAVPAGYALWRLFSAGWLWRMAAALLLLSQSYSFVKAHPEHIAYFNTLAGDTPEFISLDSDFDWGQDMILLDEALQERGINWVYLCERRDVYWNAAIIVNAYIKNCPREKTHGWFAVGRAQMMLNDNIAWLKKHQALQIGNSTIDLYHIP